jgi:signal transduction histidine kinase/ActR/RegA family two-component response regulator
MPWLFLVGMLWYFTLRLRQDIADRIYRRIVSAEARRREEAEAANRAKAYFLTCMSHEIRAPLSAIAGFTELALKSPLHPSLREHLGTVRYSASWLNHIVNEIVEYSRIEAGMCPPRQDSFSLSDIVRTSCEIARSMSDARRLTLRYHVDSAVPTVVCGDSTHLLQVLANLLDNAIRYTTDGGVIVTVAAGEHMADAAVIHFSVTDTGVGIPAERLPGLFEPLVDPASELDRRSRSCGFGLPICRRLVQMMGGEIKVQSRPGIGSTFEFSIAVRVLEKAPAALAPVEEVAAKPRLRVLLADGDAANLRLEKALLEAEGHRVTEAATAGEAVQGFLEGSFQVVLVDIETSHFGGAGIIEAIRSAEPPGFRSKLYALTGEASIDAALYNDIDGVFARPLQVDSLMQLATVTSEVGPAVPA